MNVVKTVLTNRTMNVVKTVLTNHTMNVVKTVLTNHTMNPDLRLQSNRVKAQAAWLRVQLGATGMADCVLSGLWRAYCKRSGHSLNHP